MSKIITIRAKAFGKKIETVKATVDANNTVRVFDDVAGHYTTCHSLSASAIRRVQKLADAS